MITTSAPLLFSFRQHYWIEMKVVIRRQPVSEVSFGFPVTVMVFAIAMTYTENYASSVEVKSETKTPDND